MTIRKALLWTIFIGFTAYSTWVMWQVGYMGIWQGGFGTIGSTQVTLDLVIACLLISSWMIGDAKARGVNPYPWIAAVVVSGSIAILAYLVVREHKKAPSHDNAPQLA